eukprot:UN10842
MDEVRAGPNFSLWLVMAGDQPSAAHELHSQTLSVCSFRPACPIHFHNHKAGQLH